MKRNDFRNFNESTNKVVLIINWVLDIFLILGYIAEYLKGARELSFVIFFIFLVLVPIGISSLVYIKRKESSSMKYITLAGYFVMYVFAMFNSSRIVIYVYFFPIISMYLLYYDLKLMIYSCIGIASINTARIIWQNMFLGMNSLEITTDYTIQMASVFLYAFSIIVTTKLSNKYNSEKISGIESERRKQEDLLENLLKISAIVEKNSKEVFKIVEDLHNSSNALSREVIKIHQKSNHTIDRIQNQSQLVTEIQEIISGTAEAAENMGNISKQTLETANEGINTVKILNSNVESVNKDSDGVYKNMQDLQVNCDEIQNIIKVISGISEQTNLLSLNASIESARAGEAGKGFAVVAEEIRNLAAQSKISAENISDIIKKLIYKAENSVAAFEKLKKSYLEQTRIIFETSDIFSKISGKITSLDRNISDFTGRISGISELNFQIVESIKEISSDSESTNRIVDNAASITAENEKKSEEALVFTEELKKSADEFEKYI